MALQTIKGGFYIPDYGKGWTSEVEAWTGFTIDASGEKIAMVFKVPKTGTIAKIGFATRGVSNSQTLRVGIETVNASGDPSGTQYGGSAVGTQAAPAANTYYTVTLGTGATATRGDTVAVVIQFDGTVGNANVAYFNTNTNPNLAFPYYDNFTAAWAHNAITGGLIMHLEYDDASVEAIPHAYPVSVDTIAVTFNNGSSPDERALKFTLPNPTRVSGFWAFLDLDAAVDLVLYDSDGTTVLETQSLVAAERAGTAGSFITALFDATETLTASAVYYLAVKPTSVTNVTLKEFTVSTALIMDAFSIGQNAYLSTRADAGAWTDTTTRRPLVGLILDQL